MVLVNGPEEKLKKEPDILAEGSSYRRRSSTLSAVPTRRRACSCNVVTMI